MVEVENKIQRYESYKDSDIKWLEGEIPEHWQTLANKHIFNLKKNEVGKKSDDYDLLSLTLKGIVIRDLEAGGKYPADFDTYQEVKKGDFVFCLFDVEETPRCVGLSNYDGMITGAYTVMEPNENFDRSFLYYFYLNLDADKRMKPLYTGLRNTISKDNFFSFKTFVPPLQEQTAIAQFLDDKTTKIDHAVSVKEKQIELLKERKQILIHKAVTRGLDNTVKLKDSGVEWIGEIPEHWEVCDFKRVIELIKDGTHGTYQRVTEGRVLLSAKNVHSNGIKISEEESLISEKDYQEITKNGFPKKGDLLVTCVGTIGRAFVYDRDEPIAFQRSVAFLRINKLKAIPEFFKIYVESSLYQFALKQLTKTSAQGGVYMGDIMNSIIIFPPLSDQKEISEYIETASQKIDTAVNLKQQEIEKLKEYKSSLINSVVTGKVKVS